MPSLRKIPCGCRSIWTNSCFKLLLLIITLCVLIPIFNQLIFWKTYQLPSAEFYYDFENEATEIDEGQFCRIPNLNPYDESILKFLSTPVPIVCKSRQNELVYIDNEGSFRFNFSTYYKLIKPVCHYKYVLRDGDSNIKYGITREINDGEKVEEEFVHVWCQNIFGIKIFQKLFAHIIKKNQEKMDLVNTEKISVFIFQIDSTSRLNFIRHLPKTYWYLIRALKAVVLRGYTKVGDNTFPNVIPLLTGRRPEMWTGEFRTELRQISSNETYDSWPIIWKNFSMEGYSTLFAEDMPEFSIFNYGDPGFTEKPVDHYMRPFWLAFEQSSLKLTSGHLCIGNTPLHQVQLNYILDFLRKFKDEPYFIASFLSEISHEYLNQVGSADDDFLLFFKTIFENGYLNNTLLVVLSDHGHRMDPIRLSHFGRLEGNLPFCAVSVPDSVISNNNGILNNLKENSMRLTTSFDVHETIADILYLIRGNNFVEQRAKNTHGKSLFGTIPLSRNCRDAGVPISFCPCEWEKKMDINKIEAKLGADALVKTINRFTEDYRNLCVELKLKQILEVNRFFQNNSSAHEDVSNQTFRVRVIVEPSLGMFEGIVVIDEHGKPSAMKDIDRVNKYKGQYQCLNDNAKDIRQIRKYCYCAK